jgi:hypothetical protein
MLFYLHRYHLQHDQSVISAPKGHQRCQRKHRYARMQVSTKVMEAKLLLQLIAIPWTYTRIEA